MVERKHPLNEIAGLNAVAAKPGKVLHNDTINLPSLHHCQKLLYGGTFKVCPRMAVIDKFQDFAVIPFLQRHGFFPKKQLLVGNTQTFRLEVLHRQANIKGNHIFLLHFTASP